MRVDGRIHTAAKVAWMLEHGEVPEGRRVLIACGDRACVNPAHLMLDTVRKSVLI